MLPLIINNKPQEGWASAYPSIDAATCEKIWLRTRLGEAQNWKCCWCGVVCDAAGSNKANAATIEHIVPKSKGGSDEFSNLALACRACNSLRSSKSRPPSKSNYKMKKISDERITKILHNGKTDFYRWIHLLPEKPKNIDNLKSRWKKAALDIFIKSSLSDNNFTTYIIKQAILK